MKPELDKKLCDEFPIIFQDRNAPMNVTCMCWGFPGDGWYDLIRIACHQISNSIENAKNHAAYEYKQKHNLEFSSDLPLEIQKGLKLDEMAVVASQMKEKFGTLRFYWGGHNLPPEVYSEVSGIVSMAESMSAYICEECGEKGSLRGPGWLSVRCDKCADGMTTMAKYDAWVDEQEAAGKEPTAMEWIYHRNKWRWVSLKVKQLLRKVRAIFP